MLDTNKILSYEKGKKNIREVLVICDFTKLSEVNFLPYYAVASNYGYHYKDIVFKDYREVTSSLTLPDLKYSKEYLSIIVFDVPREDFDSSVLGDLAREDDPYHIYPYLLYFEPSQMGNMDMTPQIFESAICRAKVYANSLCCSDTGFYFLTNRKEYHDESAREAEYNLEEKIEEAASILDEDKRCQAIEEIKREFDKNEELYYREHAAALTLIVGYKMGPSSSSDSANDRNTFYSFYFFSPKEKVKARKFARSLIESDNSIRDIWLYYVDKEGRKYKSGSEALYTAPRCRPRASVSLPVEERVRLYDLLEQNNGGFETT